jgi:hypothetical protein
MNLLGITAQAKLSKVISDHNKTLKAIAVLKEQKNQWEKEKSLCKS